MRTPLVDRVVEELQALPENLQRQVLEFVEYLGTAARRGKPGSDLAQYGGLIPEDDLHLMQEAIDNGCEQVEMNEWQIPPGYKHPYRTLFQRWFSLASYQERRPSLRSQHCAWRVVLRCP